MAAKTVITSSGTATQTVITMFDLLNVNVRIIDSFKTVKNVNPNSFDGIVLLGGVDINPFFYGEKNLYSQKPDLTRDSIEWYMIKAHLNHKKPIFGICRGCQFINIGYNGTLYQDLNIQKNTNKKHTGTYHELMSVNHILKPYIPEMWVNSYHHQAIKTMGYNLKPAAASRDGVIEGVINVKKRVLGLQWHPELMFRNGDERWLAPFRLFTSWL